MFALISDVTPNMGTVEAKSDDPQALIDFCVDDRWRAIELDDISIKVGDRIAIDWNKDRINLADRI